MGDDELDELLEGGQLCAEDVGRIVARAVAVVEEAKRHGLDPTIVLENCLDDYRSRDPRLRTVRSLHVIWNMGLPTIKGAFPTFDAFRVWVGKRKPAGLEPTIRGQRGRGKAALYDLKEILLELQLAGQEKNCP